MKEPSFPQPGRTNKEKPLITLKPATVADANILFAMNQKMTGLRTFSVMDDLEEQRDELKDAVTYLIEKDQRVVGYISYKMKSEKHADLNTLIVDPKYQGQGFGREALTRVLKELEKVERIELTTHPENNVALQLYLSLGFQIESRKDNYYGDGEPRLVLVKTD